MMTLAALRALIARIPAIAWVIAFACALIVTGCWGLYHQGQLTERRTAERKARTDSIARAVIVKRDAQRETDSARAMIRLATRALDTSRTKRQTLRQQVEPMIASLPLPVVELIHADDKLIDRDSVLLTAHVAVDSMWVRERADGAALDSLYTHQTEAPPQKGHHALAFAAGAVGTVAVIVLAHLVIR